MRIGVIWVGFNTEQYAVRSLQPWVNMKARWSNPNEIPGRRQDEFIIGAVSVPFVSFPQSRCDRTAEILEEYKSAGCIDHLLVSEVPTKETEARTKMLETLLGCGADVVVQVDSDEEFTEDQIARIFDYVRANPWVTWFRLSLRNAVFNPTTFLKDPFTPPRIHRVVTGEWKLHHFWDDNNLAYRCPPHDVPGLYIGPREQRDLAFASMTIPASVAFVKHWSWLSDERSKLKCEYQLRRWSLCSFRWDEPTNSLAFNEAYYRARGEPLPEVIHET